MNRTMRVITEEEFQMIAQRLFHRTLNGSELHLIQHAIDRLLHTTLERYVQALEHVETMRKICGETSSKDHA